MRQSRLILVALPFLLAMLGQLQPSLAQQVQLELAPPPQQFVPLPGKANEIEPSAVEPIGNGKLLLVADDKNRALVIAEAETGRIKQLLTLGVFAKNPKWEALALDSEGTYYVIGSHSVKENEAGEPDAAQKLKDRSHILSFRLKGEGTDASPFAVDEKTFADWDITEALAVEGYRSDPKSNRVKIEGLAVRVLSDLATKSTVRELVIGLRKPGVPLRVYAANITKSPATGSKLALRPLFTFEAGMHEKVQSELSSIEYVPGFKGFLLLTSTEDNENKFHGNTLWFVSDESITAAIPAQAQADNLKLAQLTPVAKQKVWLFGVNVKAEGLCVLSESAVPGQPPQARFALVYDNDTEATHVPGLLQFVTLTLWPD